MSTYKYKTQTNDTYILQIPKYQVLIGRKLRKIPRNSYLKFEKANYMYFARIKVLHMLIDILTECTGKTKDKGNNFISSYHKLVKYPDNTGNLH